MRERERERERKRKREKERRERGEREWNRLVLLIGFRTRITYLTAADLVYSE
jgi:hypothetical protein